MPGLHTIVVSIDEGNMPFYVPIAPLDMSVRDPNIQSAFERLGLPTGELPYAPRGQQLPPMQCPNSAASYRLTASGSTVHHGWENGMSVSVEGMWVASQPGMTCTHACSGAGLACTDEELAKRNAEMATASGVAGALRLAIVGVNVPTKGCEPTGVPSWDAKSNTCAMAIDDDATSRFRCGGSARAPNERRLCYCHAKKAPPSDGRVSCGVVRADVGGASKGGVPLSTAGGVVSTSATASYFNSFEALDVRSRSSRQPRMQEICGTVALADAIDFEPYLADEFLKQLPLPSWMRLAMSTNRGQQSRIRWGEMVKLLPGADVRATPGCERLPIQPTKHYVVLRFNYQATDLTVHAGSAHLPLGKSPVCVAVDICASVAKQCASLGGASVQRSGVLVQFPPDVDTANVTSTGGLPGVAKTAQSEPATVSRFGFGTDFVPFSGCTLPPTFWSGKKSFEIKWAKWPSLYVGGGFATPIVDTGSLRSGVVVDGNTFISKPELCDAGLGVRGVFDGRRAQVAGNGDVTLRIALGPPSPYADHHAAEFAFKNADFVAHVGDQLGTASEPASGVYVTGRLASVSTTSARDNAPRFFGTDVESMLAGFGYEENVARTNAKAHLQLQSSPPFPRNHAPAVYDVLVTAAVDIAGSPGTWRQQILECKGMAPCWKHAPRLAASVAAIESCVGAIENWNGTEAGPPCRESVASMISTEFAAAASDFANETSIIANGFGLQANMRFDLGGYVPKLPLASAEIQYNSASALDATAGLGRVAQKVGVFDRSLATFLKSETSSVAKVEVVMATSSASEVSNVFDGRAASCWHLPDLTANSLLGVSKEFGSGQGIMFHTTRLETFSHLDMKVGCSRRACNDAAAILLVRRGQTWEKVADSPLSPTSVAWKTVDLSSSVPRDLGPWPLWKLAITGGDGAASLCEVRLRGTASPNLLVARVKYDLVEQFLSGSAGILPDELLHLLSAPRPKKKKTLVAASAEAESEEAIQAMIVPAPANNESRFRVYGNLVALLGRERTETECLLAAEQPVPRDTASSRLWDGDACVIDVDCADTVCKSHRCCGANAHKDQHCSACSPSGACAECNAGFFLNKGSCQPRGPPGSACSSDASCASDSCRANRCCSSSSVAGCAACSYRSGVCRECTPGSLLLEGTCVPQSPAGMATGGGSGVQFEQTQGNRKPDMRDRTQIPDVGELQLVQGWENTQHTRGHQVVR